jgi:Mrp family chromosome partitioning ATPase
MERIKKALQLAAQERGSADVVGFGEPVVEEKPNSNRAEESARFEYVHTRVLDVPHGALVNARVIDGHGQDSFTRSYKLLRTQVLQKLAKEGWQTIAVASPVSGEGKTLTAINLAVSIANAPHHTSLLVDLDWHQPSVHEYFNYRPELDIQDYLRGEQPLSAVLVNPGLPCFCLLPCREPVADSSEQLAALGGLVRELKGRYRNRIVIFDLPPLLATDDALSFLPFVDCVLLVVEEGKTKRDHILRSMELIGEQRLLGAVMNKSRQRLPLY